LVVDASAIAEYVPHGRSAVAVGNRLRSADLHVPHVCDLEFLSTIRRALLRSEIDLERAGQAFSDFGGLPLSRHGHLSLAGRIMELRDNFTVYDASYVALAESLKAPLLTADSLLVKAVRALTSVEAIEAGD
jgi:predicted nucleic acid-binding protein